MAEPKLTAHTLQPRHAGDSLFINPVALQTLAQGRDHHFESLRRGIVASMSSALSRFCGTFTRLPLHHQLYLLAVVLLPLMWPWGTDRFGSYLYLADVMAVAALFAWAVALFRGKVRLRRSWFYAPLILSLGAAVISSLASVDRRRSLAVLPVEIYLVALAVLSYNVVRSREDMRRVFIAWMTGTAITAAAGTLGVVLFYAGVRDGWNVELGGYGSLPAGNYPRVVGFFLNFNMACNYLSVGVLMLLAMRHLRWINSWPFRCLAGSIGIMAIFTVSAGIGGILLGIGIWLWVRWRSSRPALARWAMVGGCAAAVAYVVVVTTSPRGVFLASPRVQEWEAAWRTTVQHPLFGQGVGVPIQIPDWTDPQGNIQGHNDAHNIYLDIAAHDGVLGELALFTLVIYLLRKSVPFTVEGSTDNVLRTALAIAFIQAFLYQGLSGSFEHTRHLWVLCGLLVSAAEVGSHSRSEASVPINDGSDVTEQLAPLSDPVSCEALPLS